MKLKTSMMIAIAAVMVCMSAHAAPVQRVRMILRPLFSIPSIVQAGSSFKLEVETSGKLDLLKATLEPVNNPNKNFALKLKKTGEAGTQRTYEATVPATAPEALYDLVAHFKDSTSEYERVDSQPHAVKVVKKFKSEYDIIQITDIHFNVQDAPGLDVNRIGRRLLMDASAHKPEFIIFTGDLGLEPPTYDWDYVYGYEQFLQLLRVPVYMVPGNHESYYDKTGKSETDGFDYWTAAYGPMYHSFDYGKTHFVGIADYDGWSQKWRTRKSPDAMFFGTVINAAISEKQWSWLKEDLKDSSSRGNSCIAYTHIPVDTLQGGRDVGMPKYKVPGPGPEEFTTYLTDHGCSHIFVGHNHINKTVNLGKLTQVLTYGAGTNITTGKQGYRIVRIRDGKVVSMKLHEIDTKDLK